MRPATDDLDDLLQRGFRYALALTHDRPFAEDLVQDACLNLTRRGGPWKLSYFFATIRNRFIDRTRQMAILKFHPLNGAEEPIAPAAFADDELERALGELRPEERELLYLSAVESLSASDLAAQTGRPRGTVLSILHRAKAKLRQRLSGDEQRLSV